MEDLNKPFVKVTEPVLSGAQKAAILLAELGDINLEHDTADMVLANIELTDDEVRKLRLAMQNLGRYNPHDKNHINRENAVLQETIAYGQKKGIFTPIPEDELKKRIYGTNFQMEVKDKVKTNPDLVAQIVRNWLGE